MTIGWRRSTRRDEFESMRCQLAVADAEMRASFARAITGIESLLRTEHDDRMQTEIALLDAFGGLRDELADRDASFVRALERVADAWERIADRIEADRIERRALAEAVARLAESLAPEPAVPGRATTAHVIGGTVFGQTVDLRENGNGTAVEPNAATIDAEMLQLGAVEVRGRFGDRWVEGFEVCEVVEEAGVLRYRLRRRSDGITLPALFDECNVRGVSASDEVPTRRAAPGVDEALSASP